MLLDVSIPKEGLQHNAHVIAPEII